MSLLQMTQERREDLAQRIARAVVALPVVTCWRCRHDVDMAAAQPFGGEWECINFIDCDQRIAAEQEAERHEAVYGGDQ